MPNTSVTMSNRNRAFIPMLTLVLTFFGCENWDTGFLLSTYSIFPCTKLEQISPQKMESDKWSAERYKINGLDCPLVNLYNLSTKGAFPSQTIAAISISEDGCQLKTGILYLSQSCDPKTKMFDKVECEAAKQKAIRSRDAFLDLFSKIISSQISSAPNDVTYVNDKNAYERWCRGRK